MVVLLQLTLSPFFFFCLRTKISSVYGLLSFSVINTACFHIWNNTAPIYRLLFLINISPASQLYRKREVNARRDAWYSHKIPTLRFPRGQVQKVHVKSLSSFIALDTQACAVRTVRTLALDGQIKKLRNWLLGQAIKVSSLWFRSVKWTFRKSFVCCTTLSVVFCFCSHDIYFLLSDFLVSVKRSMYTLSDFLISA